MIFYYKEDYFVISIKAFCILLIILSLSLELLCSLTHKCKSKADKFLCLSILFCVISYIYVCNGSGVVNMDTNSPITKIEFPDGASYYLSSGFTAYTSNANDTFIFTENTSETSLEEYLSNTKKNVYFCVKSGTDILFSDNLGICDSTNASEILKNYIRYHNDKGITCSLVRYRLFKIFYYTRRVY